MEIEGVKNSETLNWENWEEGPYQVGLSLDGGGMKGLSLAVVLSKIQEEVDEDLGCVFDQCASVSSGTLTALGCFGVEGGIGGEAQEVIKFYEEKGPLIFKPHFDWSEDHSRVIKTLAAPVSTGLEIGKKGVGYLSSLVWSSKTPEKSLEKTEGEKEKEGHSSPDTLKDIFYWASGGWVTPKYKNDKMKEVLEEILGDKKLSQTLIPLITSAVDLSTARPIFFESTQTSETDWYLKDLAMATCAAPTYFPSVTISSLGQKSTYTLVDGAMGSHNLSQILYTSLAQKKSPISILSLGTGKQKSFFEPDSYTGGGIFWIRDLIKFTLQAHSHTTDEFLGRLLGDRYVRYNPAFEEKIEMDDCSEIAISSWKKVGEKTYQVLKKKGYIDFLKKNSQRKKSDTKVDAVF